MNADRLLALYEKVAEAPDSVPRLRRFVLDLAVRGKLVPQDAGDEPASELLKRIAAEKARLVRAGEIRKPKPLSEVSTDEQDFPAPSGWAWSRLGGLTLITQGFAFSSGDYSKNSEDGPPLIKIGDIGSNSPEVFIKGAFDDTYLVKPGELLLGLSGSIKCARWEGPAALLNQRIARILPTTTDLTDGWLFLAVDRCLDKWKSETSKLTVQNIKAKQLSEALVPLPPLAEQRRIVAKVEELMALCDRLEEARKTREETRDKLTAASLARLTTTSTDTTKETPSSEASEEDDFASHARFALETLPALTARPDQIKALRQTILNLAVRGKLVEQDPDDEPATELLKRIALEKERLRIEKGIRAQKPALPAENFEAEATIPSAWEHVYLQDIAYQITDGTHLTPKYTESGFPFLSAQNVKPFRFMPDIHRFVSQEDFEKYRSNRRPERDDILLTRVGAGIGEAAVLDSSFEFAFYVSLCLIKVPNDLVNVDYLVIWLNSPEGRESSKIRTYGKGASQGNLNLGLIRTFKIPIPPLAEQHRIVAKVDELMALCDRLEVALIEADAKRAQLLEALLHEALQPDETELEAAE